MNISCDVIRDLLPLYVEGIASENSCKLIEEHIGNCADCTSLLEEMKAETVIPIETDVKPLQNVRSRIRIKTILSVVTALLLALTLVAGAFVCAVVPVRMSAQEAIVAVEQEEDGRVMIQLSENTQTVYSGENTICFDKLRLNWFVSDYRQQMLQSRGNYYYYEPEEGESLWYLGAFTGDEDTLLWGDGTEKPILNRRLAPVDMLLWIVSICAAMGVLLLLVGILLRRKRIGRALLAVAALLLCFAAACLFVTDGHLLTRPSVGVNWHLGVNELQYIAIAAMTLISYFAVLSSYFTVKTYAEN